MTGLTKAEPTAADVMNARFIGEGHPYFVPDGPAAHQPEYTLLEYLMCRERELTETRARLDALATRAAGIEG